MKIFVLFVITTLLVGCDIPEQPRHTSRVLEDISGTLSNINQSITNQNQDQAFIEYNDHGERVLSISHNGTLTLHKPAHEVARVLEIIANGQALTNSMKRE